MSKQDFVKNTIKKQIKAAPHLPIKIISERNFARQYGISRMTVRQAMLELTNEGWLSRKVGQGTLGHLPPNRYCFKLISQRTVDNDKIELLLENNGEQVKLTVPRSQLKKLRMN